MKFSGHSRVELVSRAHCNDIPIGSRGYVMYADAERSSVHVLWDSGKGSVFNETEITDSLHALTEEEIAKEHETTKTWYEAMKDFTIGEMFAFLEQVHSGKLGNDFCSSMCEHRNEECKECLYYDATYLRKILAMPISHKAMDYIKRKGEECDSNSTNERRRKDEERSE